MAHQKLSYTLTMVLAFGGVIACGGESNSAPPQTPANQTTTTGATADNQSTTQASQPSTMAQPEMAATGSNTTMNGSPVTTTAGTVLSGGAAPIAASSASGAGATADSSTLSDGQIVEIIQAVNNGQIDQAHHAQRDAKNNRVKQFAQHMVLDISAAQTKLSSLDTKVGITPQESAVENQIRANSEQILSGLRSSSGSDFDKAYVDAQVREGTNVLSLLDTKLIPGAQNLDLVKALQDLRTKVATNLKMAQGIQASLGQSQ